MVNDGARAEERVWRSLPEGTKEALDGGLPGTDLQTILLSVLRSRAAPTTPAEVMRQWRTDRFVRPCAVDARRLAAVEARLWQLLPPEFDGIELSPVTPMGTCVAVAPVSQNRIVPTARLSEVVSDSTNTLAIEAAVRRRRQGNQGEVHLAASHRQLRAQVFDRGLPSHFKLFALVSSVRDRGSARTEAALLVRHLRFWRSVLADLLPDADPRLELTVLDHPTLAERIADTVLPALATPSRVRVVVDTERGRGRGYYAGAAVRITARDRADPGGGHVELGDGGLTTWTAQLRPDAKERCLVTCIATERLLELSRA